MHLENVGGRHVKHGNPLGVEGRHPGDGVPDHPEGPVLEGPHGVHPRLLRRVHEAAVYPAGHPVELKSIFKKIEIFFLFIHEFREWRGRENE